MDQRAMHAMNAVEVIAPNFKKRMSGGERHCIPAGAGAGTCLAHRAPTLGVLRPHPLEAIGRGMPLVAAPGRAMPLRISAQGFA